MNWFSVAAGVCFVAAVPYGIWMGQDWKPLALYGIYACANFVAAAL